MSGGGPACLGGLPASVSRSCVLLCVFLLYLCEPRSTFSDGPAPQELSESPELAHLKRKKESETSQLSESLTGVVQVYRCHEARDVR